MNKRTLGNALTVLGSPAMLGAVGLMSVFTADGNPANLLWAAPLVIISLPLLPVYMQGEKILRACNRQDFILRTQSLARVTELPHDHTSIEKFEGKFYLQPTSAVYDEGPFDSLAEARTFLDNMGYREVVYMKSIEFDHAWEQYPLDTYWIKKS